MSVDARAFIEAKLAEQDTRHSRAGASRYLVEPNIKEGTGGLRDLHTLHWLAKHLYPDKAEEEFVEAGVFTRHEYRSFRRCEFFLWTVRCNLHFLTGRPEERLSFDLQRAMAERLGYRGHAGLSAVERFMKHYFLIAKEVGAADADRLLGARDQAAEVGADARHAARTVRAGAAAPSCGAPRTSASRMAASRPSTRMPSSRIR